jgi:hypothetical protein
MEESIWYDNMKIKLVTSYNQKLFDQYAHRFEKTYNWPFEKVVYNEDEGMFDLIPDLKSFVERNKNRPINKHKGFLLDGVRFSYKVYAYTHAILNSNDYDGLIWIDSDSVFYEPIDVDWIKEHIHRDDRMVTYLGRGSQYSECGFLYFNLKHPKVKLFASELKRMYDENLIYNEIEYHDSYIFDVVRKRFEREENVYNHNIGDGRKAHVQARSILGTVYDHTKGNRKERGVSTEWLIANKKRGRNG